MHYFLLGMTYRQVARNPPSILGILGMDESFWSTSGLFLVSSVVGSLSATSISATIFGFLGPVAGLFIPSESTWVEDTSCHMRSMLSIREIIILHGSPIKYGENEELSLEWSRLRGKDRNRILTILSAELYSDLPPGVLEAVEECENAIQEGRLNKNMDPEWSKLYNSLFEERPRYIREWLKGKKAPKRRGPAL